MSSKILLFNKKKLIAIIIFVVLAVIVLFTYLNVNKKYKEAGRLYSDLLQFGELSGIWTVDNEDYNLVFYNVDGSQYLYTSRGFDTNLPISKDNYPHLSMSTRAILPPPSKGDILSGYKYDPFYWSSRISSSLYYGNQESISIVIKERPTTDDTFLVAISDSKDLQRKDNDTTYIRKIADFRNMTFDSMPEFMNKLDESIENTLENYYGVNYKLYDHSFKSYQTEPSGSLRLFNPPSYSELSSGDLGDPTIWGSAVAEVLDISNNNAPQLMVVDFQIDVSTNPFTIKSLVAENDEITWVGETYRIEN